MTTPEFDIISFQLRPDFKYKIFTTINGRILDSPVAHVFVLSAGKSVTLKDKTYTGRENGTEYWFYSDVSDIVQTIESASSLVVTADALVHGSRDDFDPSDHKYYDNECTANKGDWAKTPYTYQSDTARCTSYSFWKANPGGEAKCCGVELNIKVTATNQRILNGVQWYQYDKTASKITGTIEQAAISGTLPPGERWTGTSPYQGTGYFSLKSM